MLQRYEQAYKVALKWIKNYTEFDFRSLGSYTHADLEPPSQRPTTHFKSSAHYRPDLTSSADPTSDASVSRCSS